MLFKKLWPRRHQGIESQEKRRFHGGVAKGNEKKAACWKESNPIQSRCTTSTNFRRKTRQLEGISKDRNWEARCTNSRKCQEGFRNYLSMDGCHGIFKCSRSESAFSCTYLSRQRTNWTRSKCSRNYLGILGETEESNIRRSQIKLKVRRIVKKCNLCDLNHSE